MTERVYAIIGHPVAQARSPAVFNELLERAGSAARMVPLDVHPADLDDALKGLRRIGNFAGAVITVPHKISVAETASARSPRVSLVGAANVLRPERCGWYADLFDGIGFVEGLRSRGHTVSGRSVAIVGAGGAGLAIAEALLGAGARVSVSDIDGQRSRAARTRLTSSGDVDCLAPHGAHEIVVNATPVGMQGDQALPFDPDILGPETLVAEVIMKPAMTPLLRKAHGRGLRIHEGRYMLDGQVSAIWTFLGMGRMPPREEST